MFLMLFIYPAPRKASSLRSRIAEVTTIYPAPCILMQGAGFTPFTMIVTYKLAINLDVVK